MWRRHRASGRSGLPAGGDLDDRAPPVGRVRAPLDQACAVKAGEHPLTVGRVRSGWEASSPTVSRPPRICSLAATRHGLSGEDAGAGAARSCQRRIPLVTWGTSCIRRRRNAECPEPAAWSAVALLPWCAVPP